MSYKCMGTLCGRQACIYEAVYASMFDFNSLPSSWVRDMAKFWDLIWNTCWIGPEELTITLWKLHAVSGLPVLRCRFEECIPPDEELFCRKISAYGHRQGRMILPLVYPILLSHFWQAYRLSRLSRRSWATISVDIWIRSFLADASISLCSTCLNDPFGVDVHLGDDLSEDTAEPSLLVGKSSPAATCIDEDLFLAGFLATWLCVFVLPIGGESVWPSIFLAASQISQGERVL